MREVITFYFLNCIFQLKVNISFFLALNELRNCMLVFQCIFLFICTGSLDWDWKYMNLVQVMETMKEINIVFCF